MAANVTFTLTIAEAEAEVRDFAAQFPTANVQRMVSLCESGRISWFGAYDVSRKALADAMAVR